MLKGRPPLEKQGNLLAAIQLSASDAPPLPLMDVPGFALITGAASGIGRACAMAFVLEGAAGVALIDVNADALDAVRTEVDAAAHARPHGGTCAVLVHRVDVSSEEHVDAVVAEVAAAFGRLDYVVNAAGIAVPQRDTASATTADWRRVLDINLNGTFFVLRAAMRLMLAQEPLRAPEAGRTPQRGSIVNISSVLGLISMEALPAYTASKHAVLGLTRTAALDHSRDGVRVNAVCPGWIETPMTCNDAVLRREMEATVKAPAVAMRRNGHPREVADAVLFLAGGRSSYVTGSALVVDGGYTAR